MNQNSPNPIFYLHCHGESLVSTKLILFKGMVNKKYTDICPKKIIRIAYNNEEGFFTLFDNETIEVYPWHKNLEGAKDVELLSPFLKSLDGEIHWTNCNFTWGGWDDEIGSYVGAVGEVNQTFEVFRVFERFEQSTGLL